MKKLSILVVLYDCEIADSETLNALATSSVRFEASNLVIWNNGPNKLKNTETTQFDQCGLATSVIETTDNISLAKIYNEFISQNTAKLYLILDDDSEPEAIFLEAISSLDGTSIGLPIIKSNNIIVSPIKNRKPVSSPDERCSNKDRVVAIGSGIILSNDICSKIKKSYADIFDERFYIYGVDTAICLRIKHLNLTSEITFLAGFNHSLSVNEIESKNTEDFRTQERANAKGLIAHHYHGIFTAYAKSLKLLLRILLNKKNRNFNTHYFMAALTGKHYLDREAEKTT
ncbi:MAG: hypothetical protein ACSHXK_11610 [Oceanococcus sp.]